jgi:Na+/proline symporter
VTTAGIFAGLVTGITLATFLMLAGHDPYRGWNAGFIALCCNFVVIAVVSTFTPVRVAGFGEIDPPAPSPNHAAGAA